MYRTNNLCTQSQSVHTFRLFENVNTLSLKYRKIIQSSSFEAYVLGKQILLKLMSVGPFHKPGSEDLVISG